jgi:hypothetical protein
MRSVRTAILCVLLTAGMVQAQQPYTPTPLQPQFPGQFGPPHTTTPQPGAWQNTPTTTQPAPSTTSQPAGESSNSAFWGFVIIGGLVAVIVWALTRPKRLVWRPVPMPPARKPSPDGAIWIWVGAGLLLLYFLTR